MPLQTPVPLGQVAHELASIGEQIRAQVARRSLTPYVIAPAEVNPPPAVGTYGQLGGVLADIGISGMALVFFGPVYYEAGGEAGVYLDIDNTGIPVAGGGGLQYVYLASGLAAETHNFRILALAGRQHVAAYLLVCPL